MKRLATVCFLVALMASVCPRAAHGDTIEQLEAKLKALDAAHKAGVFSDAELVRKKAELEAQLKAAQPDPATRKKLAALEAAREAGVFTEAEYRRKKAELLGKHPSGPKTPKRQPNPLAGRKGKTFRHAIGFSFWYPEGWTLRPQEGFLQLIPPKPVSEGGAATEIYGIVGENVAGEGIQRPDDPRVIQFLDERVRVISRFVKRKGDPSPARMARGKGTVLNWQGKNPRGAIVLGRAYVAIIRGYGVALVGVGFEDQLKARDAELRRMFASFGFGESQKDPRIVGHWLYEKHFFSGTFSSTTIRRMVLRPDGTFVFASRLLAQKEHRDGGGDPTAFTSLDTGKDPNSTGRWAAGGGVLYMFWNNGSYSECRYHISDDADGRSMLTQGESGGKMLWTFQAGRPTPPPRRLRQPAPSAGRARAVSSRKKTARNTVATRAMPEMVYQKGE